jgi:tripartite-type tricarboxylate transporter receptor subunit TctC
MKIPRRRFLHLVAGAAAVPGLSRVAMAETYPARAITAIIPFAGGSASDVVSRIMFDKMSRSMGQPIIVENRPGAGGNNGTATAAKAAPDGYTLVGGGSGPVAANVTMYKQLDYDPVKDFETISPFAGFTIVVVASNKVPVNTLQELIAYAKANPGKLSYGSAGTGTVTNLTGELFKQLIGAPDIVHIPYKGSAPGVTDLASGHIPMMTPNIGGPLLALHRAGKVRILAVTWTQRIKAAPDIPTAIEAGLPGMVAANLNGVFAPAGLPGSLAGAIANATRAAMNDQSFVQPMIDSGFEPLVDSGPDEATRTVREEIARWTPVIKSTGFRME